MIYIKDSSREKIEDLTLDNYYVVADFDKTITTADSNTTFSLFSKSGFYDKKYAEERNNNYNHYRPIELDPDISSNEKFKILKEWQEASYQLMVKYKVRESDIKRILKMKNMLKLREYAIPFIKYLNKYNIPLIINSAGCGNFIIELLKLNNCYSDNIYVYSNILKFENDIIIDSIRDIIHSMNKNDIKLPKYFFKKIKDKKYTIIIGDQLSDLEMSRALPNKNIISFGFLESNVTKLKSLFMEKYDVVLENNENFNEINKILKLRKEDIYERI